MAFGVGALSVLIIGWRAWRPAWSGDEAATVIVVRRSFAQVLATFPHDPALGPYNLAIKAWAFVSMSEPWLRLPSVLAMAGAVVGVAVVTASFAGRRAAGLSCLVMLALPATTRFGQEARPYALSVLAVTAAVVVWNDDRLVRRIGRQVALGALVVLAGAAHPYALLVIPVLVAVSLLAPRTDRRREVIATILPSVVGLLVLSPFLVVVAKGAHGQPDPPPVSAATMIEEFARLPAAVLSAPLAVPFAAVALGLAASGIAIGWARGGPLRRGAVLATSWLLLPPVALCAFQWATGSPGLVARYWTISLPAIAMAGGFALNAVWARRPILGVACLLLLSALALPSQLAIRTENGHLGQRWRDLPKVLALPGLSEAMLLAEGWSYRGLVGNEPSIADRLPLVRDPVASGRVNPSIASTNSEEFRAMVRDHDLIVVLQAQQGFSADLPKRESFTSFRDELDPFPTADVLCNYYGEPLGVFAKTSATLASAEARALAERIAAIEPGSVVCVAPDGG